MFDNLTVEIFYYSLIPVSIIAIMTLFVLLFNRRKQGDYRYNYIIKVLLIIMISFVLPLITGYTIWFIKRYLNKGVLIPNIASIIILALLIVALIILLIIICRKLYKSFKK